MIEEVEFSSFLEYYSDSVFYMTPNCNDALINGVLSEDGKILDISINIPLPEGPSVSGVRKIYLYFNNIDFSSRFTDLIKLEADSVDPYKYDLSRVLTIPRKVYDTRGTSELLIELYTYEANLTTDYGSKRLSVPYSIYNTDEYSYSNSTDGVYQLFLLDFNIWSTTVSYGIGDIVASPIDGSLYKSLVDDNIAIVPTDPDAWATPTDEDIIDYGYGSTRTQPLLSVYFDMMISRYAKYNYIQPTLDRTSFKKYDNDLAGRTVDELQMFREKAVFELMRHRPIEAAYFIHTMKLVYSKFSNTTQVRQYNIKYTL